jgi:hypothetical protein
VGGSEIEQEEVGESGRRTVRERGEGEDPIGLLTTQSNREPSLSLVKQNASPSRSATFSAWSVFLKITDAVASPPICEVFIQPESSMRPMVGCLREH